MSHEKPDLNHALDVLAEVVRSINQNPEAALAPDAIQAAALVEEQDLGLFARFRRNLKERHITVSLFDNALDRYKRQQREQDDVAAMTAMTATVVTTPPWPTPVSGDLLINEIKAVVNATLSVSEGAADVLALWTLFSHLVDSFDIAPILSVTSPIRNCGKTTLMKLLAHLTRRAYLSSNLTSAIVVRTIDAIAPTLLIDEADSFAHLRPKLRNILNGGHDRATAFVDKFIDGQSRRFVTFCAKAVAAIGSLPDSWASKSIAIVMKRKRRDEQLVSLYTQTAHLDDLLRKAMRWADDHASALRTATPAPLAGDLDARVQDNWRPLLAIADAIGPEYALCARDMALRLARSHSNDHTLLLDDIHDIFKSLRRDKISSEQLCRELRSQSDKPYREQRLTPYRLSQRLDAFDIHSHTIRARSKNGKPTSKGYVLDDFADAFERYLTKWTRGVGL
jgi:putative DNA primase/helicase